MGMRRRGVDGEFASCTVGTCSFITAGGAFGFVAQLMGGGVDVAVSAGFDGVGCVLVLGNKSATKVQ
jgi:hypothetical protein